MVGLKVLVVEIQGMKEERLIQVTVRVAAGLVVQIQEFEEKDHLIQVMMGLEGLVVQVQGLEYLVQVLVGLEGLVVQILGVECLIQVLVGLVDQSQVVEEE